MAPGSVHMGFEVAKGVLGQVFICVIRFSPVNIIPPWLSILIIWVMKKKPVGGRSSKTEFHAIDMNNKTA
jgi:hypothetical protein